jgi:hypothetical protein
LLWGVSLSFCAFAGWLFLALALEHAPVATGLLAGCFLMIAITMLAGTIELTLDYRRYSAVRLTLTGEPPAVGKRLDGVIELPARAAATWIRAEFACVHVNCETLGADRTAGFEKDCWSDRRQFPVQRNGMRRNAVVRFDILDSLPPSSGARAPAEEKSDGDYYVWQLRIEASGLNPAFHRTLRVQVLPSAAGHGDRTE